MFNQGLQQSFLTDYKEYTDLTLLQYIYIKDHTFQLGRGILTKEDQISSLCNGSPEEYLEKSAPHRCRLPPSSTVFYPKKPDLIMHTLNPV